jgi:crotonobetainyl-CoA:carnitine CoA-transferase CaiB-like acyl-CoA transferase
MTTVHENTPLAGLRVIDLTHARAGPTCVKVLADWGATVFRIERPPSAGAGEEIAGKREEFDFQNLHRNKQSIHLNLKAPEGKKIFLELAATCDVIVENLRPDVKHRLGIDYESVRKVNPRIVYGSISGFGQDGPIAYRAGVDQIAQGMGGLMSITGLPGQGPVRAGIPIADLGAGAFLAQGILVALYARERTGVGSWVRTSLIEAMISLLDFQAVRWLIKGDVPKQEGNNHPIGVPIGVYPTTDGHINIAGAYQLWERMCEAMGALELLEDPRFKNSDLRLANRDVLNGLISEHTKNKPMAEWIEIFAKAGVPCGPIYSIDQTFADPQVQHLQIARPVQHKKLGELKLVAQPVSLSGYDRGLRTAVPDPGEHTADVLASLGYDEAAQAKLQEKHVI